MNLRRRATLSYSRLNRKRKAAFAMEFIRSHEVKSVLLVGVSYYGNRIDNSIESVILREVKNVVATGIAENVEGWDNYVSADGRSLPFGAGEFDMVYSNAVIEHVGGVEAQRLFLAEHNRVGRHWIATCPNRFFPVEAHTDILFRHMRRAWVDPREPGSVTRLLSRTDLQQILPRGRVRGYAFSPTLSAVSD